MMNIIEKYRNGNHFSPELMYLRMHWDFECSIEPSIKEGDTTPEDWVRDNGIFGHFAFQCNGWGWDIFGNPDVFEIVVPKSQADVLEIQKQITDEVITEYMLKQLFKDKLEEMRPYVSNTKVIRKGQALGHVRLWQGEE